MKMKFLTNILRSETSGSFDTCYMLNSVPGFWILSHDILLQGREMEGSDLI